MNLFVILIISLMSFSTSFAEINPATGELTQIHLDSEWTGRHLDVPLIRIFHSRNSQAGFFGQRWCSIFDEKVVEENNQLVYKFCGAGRESRFSFGQSSTLQGFLGKKAKRVGDTFLLTDDDETQRTFNSDGWLIQVSHPSGEKLQIARDRNGLPKSITFLDKLYEITTKDNRIQSLQSPNGLLRYQYAKDELAKVTKKNVQTYAYSRSGQKLNWTVGKEKSAYLLDKLNRILKYGEGRCSENLDYAQSGSTVTTNSKVLCNGQILDERQYVSLLDTNQTKLVGQIQKSKSSEKDIRLHPNFGYPVSVTEKKGDKQTTKTYSYDREGRITALNDGVRNLKLTYKDGARSEIQIENTSGIAKMTYIFDQFGRLSAVADRNSKFEVTYAKDFSVKTIKNGDRVFKFGTSKKAQRKLASYSSLTQKRPALIELETLRTNNPKDMEEFAVVYLRFMEFQKSIDEIYDVYKGVY